MKKLTLLLFMFFWISDVFGVELQPGYSYVVSSGSIETTSGQIIENGQRLKVLGFQGGWAVRFQILDQNHEPTGDVLVGSIRWTAAAVRDLELDDVVAAISGQSRQVEDRTAPKEDCPPIPSFKPPPSRPHDLMARYESDAPSDIEFKSDDDLKNYFSCWRSTSALQSTYENTYKASLDNAADIYARSSNRELSSSQTRPLLSCLIHRESAHWRGGTSNTGAIGLAQMIGQARSELRSILSFTPRENAVARYDRRIQIQRDEREAGRLTQGEMNAGIRVIEAEKRNYLRSLEVYNLWHNIPLRNRPTSGDITESFVANNNNHQAIIALSTLLLKNCEIRMRDSGYEMSPQMRLFACSGAYNMGTGGFMSNAMDSRGPQTLSRWIENLRNSNSSQKNETINHLISIDRCMRKDQNYPPCGTASNTCKEEGLQNFNACQERPDIMCVGERSRCN